MIQKILTSTPENLERAISQLADLAKDFFDQEGRTIVYRDGELWLVSQDAAGNDVEGLTSLRYDTIHHDEGQNLDYIANPKHSLGYNEPVKIAIQQIINDLELVEDDDFTPTPEEELTNKNKEA